jgi:hypothetical protein
MGEALVFSFCRLELGAFLILGYELGSSGATWSSLHERHDAVEFEGCLPRIFFQRWSTFSIRLTNDHFFLCTIHT